jgi:hypothetical protein
MPGVSILFSNLIPRSEISVIEMAEVGLIVVFPL